MQWALKYIVETKLNDNSSLNAFEADDEMV